MIFDQKYCYEVMSLDIRLVSSSIGSWVINTRRIEAEEEEKKTGKTIVHSKTVVAY